MTAVSEEKQERCTLCGRWFDRGELIWSSRRQAFVCPYCLDEEKSCGCEDE